MLHARHTVLPAMGDACEPSQLDALTLTSDLSM